MTLKSRCIGLVTILLLLAMAPSSFAQISLQLFPDTSTGEIQTNRNAQTATPGTPGAGLLVTGSFLGASPLTTTTLRVVYPGPITSQPASINGQPNCIDNNASPILCDNVASNTGTNVTGIPVGDPLSIQGASGIFAGITGLRLNTSLSRIEMQLNSSACIQNYAPGVVAGNGGTADCANTGGAAPQPPITLLASGSFRIVGVRFDANGKTGAQTISASLNSSANNYILASTGGTIVSNLGPGIGSFAIGAVPGNVSKGTATIFTNGNVAGLGQASLLFTEGFASAWRANGAGGAGACATASPCQSGNSTTNIKNGTRIKLSFANVPVGVTLTLGFAPNVILTGTINPNNGSMNPSITVSTITSAATSTEIFFTRTSTTTVENLELDITGITLSTTAQVSTPGAITVTATVDPFGDGVDANGLPRDDQGYPSVTEADLGPVTVVNIVPANTTLLTSYAFVGGAFDTGLSVANTTADPFGTGAGGATKANGTLTLDFFPTTSTGGASTPFSLTTSSTVKPGTGLSSDGTLAAGATWTVLLSQLMSAAGQTATSFTGYFFIRANFLDAHGNATVTDFKTYSLATNVLVVPPPATNSRNGGAAIGAESLGN